MELVSPWHNPALRALASESVVQATRHVRALRNFASRLRSAGDSRAAGSNSGQKAERPVAPRRELPPPPPPPVKQEEDDFEEDGEFESGESEDPVAPGVAAKSDPARRPPEPKEPPRLVEAAREDRGQATRSFKRQVTPREAFIPPREEKDTSRSKASWTSQDFGETGFTCPQNPPELSGII